MTSDQIELVRISFSKIQPVVEEAAVLFYARLFECDPSLRPLFQTDIREQGRKLMDIIGFAVDRLDEAEKLTPTLRELGARHVEYGVKEDHYDVVGDALLWTLRKALKDEYTDEMNKAWAALYSFLSESMKSGAIRSTESVAS
jgi:hemoglobin-like flavoprotein